MDTTSTISGASTVDHREVVTRATVDIFNATCGVQLQPLEQPQDQSGSDGVIIAVISLVGDIGWSIFLGMTRTSASTFAMKFAGFEIPFESPDMGDAIGELTNILAGQVKNTLDRQGIKIKISFPSVMRGESLEVFSRSATHATKMCFESPEGRMWTGVIWKNGEGGVS